MGLSYLGSAFRILDLTLVYLNQSVEATDALGVARHMENSISSG